MTRRAQVRPLDVMNVDVAFLCPFCGAQAGAVAKPTPAVIHAEPHCKSFADLDALDFIVAARKAYDAGGSGMLS